MPRFCSILAFLLYISPQTIVASQPTCQSASKTIQNADDCSKESNEIKGSKVGSIFKKLEPNYYDRRELRRMNGWKPHSHSHSSHSKSSNSSSSHSSSSHSSSSKSKSKGKSHSHSSSHSSSSHSHSHSHKKPLTPPPPS